MKIRHYFLIASIAGLSAAPAWADITLLNVSYDPTRELYQEFNAAFAKHWKAKTGEQGHHQAVARRLRQAGALGDRRARGRRRHAGAGLRHRRDRREGQAASRRLAEAPAATTARPTRRPSCSWCARAIRRASRTGTTSSKPGVAVITPNPKTSGGARWNYLAAWGYALQQARRRRARRRSSSQRLYKNVPVLDSGARGSTTTFVQRGIGDVFIVVGERGVPRARRSSARTSSRSSCRRVSILAEPPVTVVDKVVDKQRHAQGRRGLPGVPLLATKARRSPRKHFYRPRDAKVAAKYAEPVPEGEAVHDRRGVRRLAEGAEDALRRRRHLRPDLRPVTSQ